MNPLVTDFFPEFARTTWVFSEQQSNKPVSIEVISREDVNARKVELNYPESAIPPRLFFNRMTIRSTCLELTQFIFEDQVMVLDPPLILTLDTTERNEVSHFLPDDMYFSTATPPYHCFTTSKELGPIEIPGTDDGLVQWKISLEARGSNQEVVYQAQSLCFVTTLGLTEYVGHLYSGFFIYERVLEPQRS